MSTSQGRPYGIFQRAIKRRNVVAALAAAHELPQLSLDDALELTLLVARKDSRRHPRIAARGWARYLEEDPTATIEEAGLVASALLALPGAGFQGRSRRCGPCPKERLGAEASEAGATARAALSRARRCTRRQPCWGPSDALGDDPPAPSKQQACDFSRPGEDHGPVTIPVRPGDLNPRLEELGRSARCLSLSRARAASRGSFGEGSRGTQSRPTKTDRSDGAPGTTKGARKSARRRP